MCDKYNDHSYFVSPAAKSTQQIAEGWGRKTPSNVEAWSRIETALMVAGSSQSKVGFAGRVNINVIEKVRQVFQEVLCAQGLALLPDYWMI